MVNRPSAMSDVTQAGMDDVPSPVQHDATTDESRRLYAYMAGDHRDMPIRTAPVDREWMDKSHERFAYRCLPLTIANQAGWVIHNPITFTAVWEGGPGLHNLCLHFADDDATPFNPLQSQVITVAPGIRGLDPYRPEGRDARITSHFGCGVVTFSIPYLFRTPPSINLWVKGPSNWIKDGAQALEGIVESDWSPATFTMNWKITRPNYPVRFERGEPICMVVPVPRGLSESLEPICAPLSDRPDLEQECLRWSRARADFLQGIASRDRDAVDAGWQRHYMKGTTVDGAVAFGHQTRLHLKEFRQASAKPAGQSPASS